MASQAILWVIAFSTFAAVVLGGAAFSTSIRVLWVTKNIAFSSLVFGLFGALIMVTPKFGDVLLETKQLKIQLKEAHAELKETKSAYASLQSDWGSLAQAGFKYSALKGTAFAFSSVKGTDLATVINAWCNDGKCSVPSEYRVLKAMDVKSTDPSVKQVFFPAIKVKN